MRVITSYTNEELRYKDAHKEMYDRKFIHEVRKEISRRHKAKQIKKDIDKWLTTN